MGRPLGVTILVTLLSGCTTQVLEIFKTGPFKASGTLDVALEVPIQTIPFAAPEFGSEVFGQLVFGLSQDRARPHCTGSSYSIPEPFNSTVHLQQGDQKLARIVLAQRGGCSLAQKIWVAQVVKGADAVIIVDNAMLADSISPINEIEGSLQGIDEEIDAKEFHAPSVLIPGRIGFSLLGSVHIPHAEVFARLSWKQRPFAKSWQPIGVHAWLYPSDSLSVGFLQDFATYRRALADQVKFELHFVIDRDEAEQELATSSPRCFGNCTQSSFSPAAVADSEEVLKESLRWLCLHQIDRMQPSLSLKFWDYARVWAAECASAIPPMSRFGQECTNETLDSIGAGRWKTAVERCVRDCGSPCLKSTEALTGWPWSPPVGKNVLFIGGCPYSGPLQAADVLRVICRGMKAPLAVCSGEPTAPPGQEDPEDGASDFRMFLLTVGMFSSVALCAIYAYRRSQRKYANIARQEFLDEVQAQMGTYRPLV